MPGVRLFWFIVILRYTNEASLPTRGRESELSVVGNERGATEADQTAMLNADISAII